MHFSVNWFRHGWGLAVLAVALLVLFVTVLTRLPEPVMAPVALLLFGLVQCAVVTKHLVRARRAPGSHPKN